jgi:hypothetical protein
MPQTLRRVPQDVEALPGRIYIQPFVGDRLQRLATSIDPLVPKILIWHLESPLLPIPPKL